ncbi:hypothetical protein Athai_32390 [Actinocatenispora thailandica]|uniref:Chitinase n=1 Tax=Actinocatenispora thailandica TaxID=227318 RepID=A0A7R7HXH0_9ACTN|nr:chitinase [Actinocatenispora thailandica]BCJ35736.1 hypothetical protein Athai_32390 [Actinocatenispora thailandica]
MKTSYPRAELARPARGRHLRRLAATAAAVAAALPMAAAGPAHASDQAAPATPPAHASDPAAPATPPAHASDPAAPATPPAHASDPAAPATPPGTIAAAPYYYVDSYNRPDPVDIMRRTGVRWFTLAFVVAPDATTCSPQWDGGASLDPESAPSKAIGAIRRAGGDVIPSLGGGGEDKLGQACGTAQALADAYQRVIDAYRLTAVDLDIEGAEFADPAARQRNVAALRLLQDRNPGLRVYLTVPVFDTGFSGNGVALVHEARAARLDVTAWAGMAFWFGKGAIDMGDASIRAMNGMQAVVRDVYGMSDREAYRRIGLSSLAGVNEDPGEVITLQDFRQVLGYAYRHRIGRLTFWNVNRDRQCRADGSDLPDTCSGVRQAPYEYTRMVARYRQPPA